MCGIIGLVNGNISQKIYLGMCSLQHRGQDTCGMLTCDKGDSRFRMHKAEGKAFESFTDQSLKNLAGNMGIGHLRYPTVGGGGLNDAQPFVVENNMNIGLAHNGNVANFSEIRNNLKTKMKSMCDGELILNYLVDSMKEERDIFDAVENIMNGINGAYSTLAISPKEGLIVFRDPHAIKPLVLSKNGAASENVALDIIQEEVIRDVKPGECVIIDDGEIKESRQLVPKEKRHCMFEWVYFSRPDSTLENISVYETRLKLGRELAKQFNHEVDVVVPVPDTSRTSALGFSEELKVPMREGLIKNRYIARTFIMPSQGTREMMVNVKLNPIIKELRGKRVALVDDSIVRGTTSKKLIKQVRKAGADEVHFVVACPPIKYPCYYGIDMCKKEELLAGNKNIEEITKELGADSVTYQSIDGLKKSIGTNDLCMACLNADYPTDCSKLLNRTCAGRPYE